MPRITEDLLRKRAEHNEGCLSTLEEIALHQQDLIKIELFEKLTRHIKIILLQNNQIEKMEGLNKLKELEYLNLAINNIDMIEGVGGCESLNKLDLTCNFIELKHFMRSITNLRKVKSLREIYLLGNPCTDWVPHRLVMIEMLPQLVTIDGKPVTPIERIEAGQRFDDLLEEMEDEIERLAIEDSKRTKEKQYSKEYRKKMYEEMREDEEKEKKDKGEKKPVKKESSMYTKDGKMRQCNEGRYKFKIDEFDDPEWSFFELELPRYFSTELLDVNLFPNFISVRIKDKLFQLKLWDEIIVSECKIQRAKTTGKLHITMKKFIPDGDTYKLREIERRKKEIQQEEQLAVPKHFGTLHLGDKKRNQNRKNGPLASPIPFIGNIQEIQETNMTERERMIKEKEIEKMIEEDEDLDDLPDLE